MKSLHPKKLSFDEMWKAHKKYKQADSQSFIDVVDMLYPKRKRDNASELLSKAVIGLTYNSYSSFVEFIASISNGD